MIATNEITSILHKKKNTILRLETCVLFQQIQESSLRESSAISRKVLLIIFDVSQKFFVAGNSSANFGETIRSISFQKV